MKSIILTIDNLITRLKAKNLFKTAQRLLQVKTLIIKYNQIKSDLLAEIEQAKFVLNMS
jgi:hypothetical protein